MQIYIHGDFSPKCQGNQITKAASLTANKDIFAKNATTFLR
jgi:hypothetical protein